MDRKRLFSIGKLSKLTGVHIQSLRYYETLGILNPAWVDRTADTATIPFPRPESWRPSNIAWSWTSR